MHRFKYYRQPYLSRPIGRFLATGLVFPAEKPDLLTSVPLHPSRVRERGYDQALLLAVSIARATGIPCQQLLVRTKATPSQTSLSAAERRQNVAGAFALKKSVNADYLKGKRILLADDIYTTGSTMNEAAGELIKAGAAEVAGVAAAVSLLR